MRLLVVTSDYPPALGGMAEYSEAWAAGLAAAGYEVEVLARGGPVHAEARPPRVPATTASWRVPPWLEPLPAYRHLARVAARFRPGLVFAHTWIGWAPALAYLKGRTGVRYFVAAHGAEILGPRRSPYYRFLMYAGLKAADRVLPVSRFTAEAVASLGIARDRIAVIGNGVDPDRFRPAPRDPELVRRYGLADCEVLVTVGGLVDRKGHDIVIEALARLKDERPRLKYLIVGGWALRSSREQHLREMVKRLGLEDRVVFTGFVDDAQLPEYYRLGDVFVMPGREVADKGWVEGFGISYLEAAGCGLPIVASPAGGAADAVSGENALMVPPEDPAATADALRKLFADRALRRKMSLAGIAWARRNAWNDRIQKGIEIIRRMEEIYEL